MKGMEVEKMLMECNSTIKAFNREIEKCNALLERLRGVFTGTGKDCSK